VRCEPAIDNEWGTGGPEIHGGQIRNNFSVRWTKSVSVVQPTSYALRVTVDDGVRLFVNGGEPVLSEWREQPRTDFCVEVELDPGSNTIVMEYFEALGEAVAILVLDPGGECDSDD
jgi:hypothetical protein